MHTHEWTRLQPNKVQCTICGTVRSDASLTAEELAGVKKSASKKEKTKEEEKDPLADLFSNDPK